MRTFLNALAVLGSLTAATMQRTVTFTVENMSCAACPYIVQSAMTTVPGVAKVEVSFGKKAATVTFDEAKTTTAAIAAASSNAGYPAHLMQQGN